MRLEILVEEKSMQYFLAALLPNLLPSSFKLNINCFIRPHSGKSDLKKRLAGNIRAFQHYTEEVIVLIVHDQDSNDCKKLKTELIEIIRNNSSNIKAMVRIACRELENWYLGDLSAIEKMYPESKATNQAAKANYRKVDNLTGSEEMRKFSKNFAKTSCARDIVQHMTIRGNTSVSFNHLLTGLQKLLS